MKFFKKKPILASLIVIAVGILITSFMFVYYHYHLGIKPCKNLPSDAANCGDGDFGGVFFFLIGVPVTVFGIACLFHFWRPSFLKRNR